jgi:hypothetical protein
MCKDHKHLQEKTQSELVLEYVRNKKYLNSELKIVNLKIF